MDDALGKALDNCSFPDARFTDQNGIVLSTPAKYLDDTLYFSFTPNQWIKFVVSRVLSEIPGKLYQVRRVFLLGTAGLRS